MKFLSWLKAHRAEAAAGLIAAALPAYLIRFRIGPFPATALELAEIAAIIALAAAELRAKRFRGFLASLATAARGNALLAGGSALVLVAVAVGIAVSPDKRAALGIAKAYFWEPMALAWLMIAVKPNRETAFRAALGGFMASAGVVVAYGFLQFAFPALIPATWTAERRITSVFGYPNAAALFLAPLVPLFLATPLGLALSAAAAAAIVLAKSAGGLIAASASLFAVGVSSRKTRWAAVAAAAVAGLAVFLAPPLAGLRQQVLMQDWSGRVHRIGWSESWAMLKDHPLWGAGLNGFPAAVAPYHHAQGIEIFQYPHNIVLATWSELGLAGIAGFALILAWFFRRAFKLREPLSKSRGPFMAAAMIAMLVHGLVDVPYFKNDLAMMFWLLAAIMAL